MRWQGRRLTKKMNSEEKLICLSHLATHCQLFQGLQTAASEAGFYLVREDISPGRTDILSTYIFCEIFQISTDLARIFTKSNLLGVRLHPLHHWWKWSTTRSGITDYLGKNAPKRTLTQLTN